MEVTKDIYGYITISKDKDVMDIVGEEDISDIEVPNQVKLDELHQAYNKAQTTRSIKDAKYYAACKKQAEGPTELPLGSIRRQVR